MLIWGGAVVFGIVAALWTGLSSDRRPFPVQPVEAAERFRTTTPHGETDSLTVYRGRKGSSALLFATDKLHHRVQVFDAASGKFIKDIGTHGDQPGQFRRPNGIAAWERSAVSDQQSALSTDLLFVVERDGRRVQALRLPEMTPFGSFGEGDLAKPYGVAVMSDAKGLPRVFITDNAWKMSQRVRRYEWRDGRFVCTLAFGDTRGPGVLRLVESIAADPEYHRLYICDEHNQSRNVKVYSDEGAFLGQTFGDRYITDDPEGVAVWPDGSRGWIVLTNQGKTRSVFHLFDRVSLLHVGAFVGKPSIANTDGVALSPSTLGPLIGGGFFAVDNDGVVAAYSLLDISDAVGMHQK